MPENKNQAANDKLTVTWTDFKTEKFDKLIVEISRVRTKASDIAATVRSRRDSIEERLKIEQAEQEAQKSAENSTVKTAIAEVGSNATAAVEEVKTSEPNETPATDRPAQADNVAIVEQKSKKNKKSAEPLKPKTEFERIETAPDGTQKRMYEPPKAKPTVETRVFGNGGYQQRRPQKQQNGRPQSQPVGSGTRRIDIANLAQQAPVKQNTQKGKKQNQNGSNKFEDRNSNKRSLLKKGFISDERVEYDENGEEIVRNVRTGVKRPRNVAEKQNVATTIENAIITTDPVSIKTLSEKIGKTAAEIITKLFTLGIMKTINDSVDFDTAELVANELGVTLEYKPEVTKEDTLTAKFEIDDIEDLDNLVPRPPIITIMGHVDHGKTSLLDYIRKSNVTGGEAGGITQHIGAYTVMLNGSQITFLDTPGHEAFTSMRARGAQVTDIAVLVVAADDGIMPQTIEAINHAKQANVPIIVALNKMDKPGANPDRVLQQLAEKEIVPEEWGGDTPVVRVSAKTGMGVEELLEQILVRAEVEELRANPNRSARGTIIEAKLDKGLGKIATILVQNGTLHIGDNVVAGICTGKIRAMIDDKGRKVRKAGPSTPVSVTGWDGVPDAGDRIDVVPDEKFAKELAEERRLKVMAAKNDTRAVSLNDLFDKISKGELKTVKLIIKADVQGSVEAVSQSLKKLGNDEVSIDIIHSAVGGIIESDVSLAETSGAIIIGFNVRPDINAKALAAQHHVDIRFYNIIYNAIEDVENAVKGMLAPKFKEVTLGSAEVRELFKISGVGTVAGCHVLDGKIARNAKARLVREGKVEYTGDIASLRHGKEDVKEIARNFDCGIMLTNYQDMKVGDIIEAFVMETVNED